MPPAKTGIAHYSSMLVPALRQHIDVQVIDSSAHRALPTAHSIYQLGNNPHHEWIYLEAMKTPGVVVLHDVVLHHLIVEMTLARGDVEGYVAALRANHGEAGAAWARGRAAGLHSEMGNFLFPASIELANRSSAVIVHNRWAADLLRSFGVGAPICVVPHPVERLESGGHRVQVGKPVIGVFGFLTSAKRADVILEAVERAGVELLVVGEAAPNVDTSRLKTTGYVSDEEFERYYSQVDRIVNLRYPSAGETSGTLLRAFVHGKPIAVSDYAQFAEVPDSCATKIPIGEGEVESLVDFFTRGLDTQAIAKAQREWLEANARMELTVEGYLRALNVAPPTSAAHAGEGAAAPPRTIPLFPALDVISINGDQATIRNRGDFTLRAKVYGQPSYRMIAKLFEGGREIDDRWIELPRDLAPGETTTITIPYRGGATLRLYHAIEGIPMLEPEAWHAAAL
jgi:glycosyltransferase involved in cell wall biosynthesis